MKNHILSVFMAVFMLFVSFWLAILPPPKNIITRTIITRTRIEFAERLSDTVRFFYVFFVAKKVDNMKQLF